MGWSSFPPAHKKSLGIGVAAYALTLMLAAGWIWSHSGDTIKDWDARIPQAETEVNTVYATPQITDAKSNAFPDTGETAQPAAGGGSISLIMTDIGLSDSDTNRALSDLPPEVALAFSPYSPKLKDWLKQASLAHRETLILIPMEPLSFPLEDPGPQALLLRQSDADNARNLYSILNAADGTMGAMNYMGSGMLQDSKDTSALLQTLKKRSKLFIENPDGGTSTGQDAADATGAPYIEADIAIDDSATDTDIQQQLLALEKIAHDRGYAVGIAQPYPLTFNIIKSWAASLEKRGIKLIPPSDAWKAKVQHDQAATPQQPQATQSDDTPPPLP
ncbi:MAG: divergent polysaccharide deacetylase family protein [Micavibrio sp.]|nr:divergent polysaccharide deacetylase family protein [Micavibrio sp.]